MRARPAQLRLLALTVAIAVAWPGNVPAEPENFAAAPAAAGTVATSSAHARTGRAVRPVFDKASIRAGSVVVDDRSDEADEGDDGLDLPSPPALMAIFPGSSGVDSVRSADARRPRSAVFGCCSAPFRLRC